MSEQVKVGIIMGSDSDLGVMLDAARVLKQLGIGWEIKALSAHRTPHHVQEWVEGLEDRGIQVVIAGAGAAAHLTGVIAALTPLPVIGVPVKSAALDGLDSLLSIVQMPPGIPVATIGIIGYSLIAILALMGRWWLVFEAAQIGFLCAAFFSYLEAYVMEKWCIYCLWSQGIMTAILLVTIGVLIVRWQQGRRTRKLA